MGIRIPQSIVNLLNYRIVRRLIKYSAYIGVFLFHYYAFETRSHSYYKIPKENEAFIMSGILIKKKSLNNWREGKIVLSSSGKKYYFGCYPNDRHYSECLDKADFNKIVGKRVTFKYFIYDNAKRNKNYILSINQGSVVYYRYEIAVKRLYFKRQYDREQRIVVPLSIFSVIMAHFLYLRKWLSA